jgi:hypothetical protein
MPAYLRDASCLDCVHYRPAGDQVRLDSERFLCAAFPTSPGIPPEITSGEVSHTEPYPGDHGIQYEPKDL